MRLNPENPDILEPAVRDARKLRRTALVLCGLMFLGGWLVLFAYNRHNKKQWLDTRPAFAENRLTLEKDLPVIRQDGSSSQTLGTGGKVCIVQAVSASQAETCVLPVNVMQRLAAHYSKNSNCVLISMVIDSGAPETVRPMLAKVAQDFGATLPQWWVATNQPEVLHKFIKKELHASKLPHQESSGRWVYDTTIFVIDRNRHIRKGVVPQKKGGPPYVTGFDFAQAAEWDARGIKTKTDFTNVEEMEFLLIRTIDELLGESVK